MFTFDLNKIKCNHHHLNKTMMSTIIFFESKYDADLCKEIQIHLLLHKQEDFILSMKVKDEL